MKDKEIVIVVICLLLVCGMCGCIESEKEGNQLPTCSLSANPSSGDAPLTVTFSMSASDTDGSISSWSLDVNNDGSTEYSGSGTPPSTKQHTYNTANTYTAKLTVIDDDSATDDDTQQITVLWETEGNFSIACWNLQRFGPTKASNDTLLTYYADKFDDYDMFIVQEITDASGTAIVALANKLSQYSYIISTRAGTTSYKEQYAIFYNSRATKVSQYDWTPEKQDEFERPPFQATFTVNNWTFTLYTIHAKPDYVPSELSNLETIVSDPDGDTVIIGDLNADGSYYDETNIMHFTTWNWAITNDMDTTVASSDNTYDRIIINTATNNNFLSAGIMNDVTSDQSDHYLVYAVFDTHIS